VPRARASALVDALDKRGVKGAVVGEVVEQPGVRVTR
jgi:hydrogenase maturation factor